MNILVTAGAIIRDPEGRILLQRRSDYGDWGLPGGGMEPGETVEATMRREVLEETGLEVGECEFYAVYSGERMQYTYPDGNEVVFVMFLFNADADLRDRIEPDGQTLIYEDNSKESLQLKFVDLESIRIEDINAVQKPIFEDLKNNKSALLRT
ncbi:NUDIX domain-containing protein [Paenibacillus sp. DYY-L-2]|uniref:NUDIX domain-containing protein n=1 Tax=Paenibacillus sp. DYY-L-2 TaxID=3447013 RepID=UPI003F4FA37E